MVERRLKWLAWFILFWGAVIFYNLISLQVFHHDEYVRMARARQEKARPIPAPRGTIYDRTGRVLALSTPVDSIHVNPLKIKDLDVAAQILGAELQLDVPELYGALKAAQERGRGFLWIKRKVDYETARRIANLGLDWINMERESRRNYPNGSLAAHLLGGVDFEEKGNGGIEKALDQDLRGELGKLRLLTDVKRRGIESELAAEARPGTPVTLTIDWRVQFTAERELAAAVQAKGAVSGSVVVINPHNGDVLAIASYPTYDPNEPPPPGAPDPGRRNHAVGVPFEPGSVFKVMTMSAAFETTNLRPDTPIDCHGGVLRLPGRVVRDSHLGLGVLPMETVFAKSSNVGAIQVGYRVGQDNMYEYVRKFGFGQKTGITLPGESAGKLRKLKNWGTTSLASVAMGQEISVTTVQLAQAISVLANGGLLVKPRLVLRKGEQSAPAPQPVRIVKPETAITMRQMMEGVVLRGTGTGARVRGYSVGGKTGTGQIFDVTTHRYTHTYNGSFVGFAPIQNPQIVVVVTLNGTRGNSGFGGAAAAPVFKAVATEALRVLEVPKDVPDETPPATQVTQVSDLSDADTTATAQNILEDGDDDPDPATPVVGPRWNAESAPKPAGPTVPNFVGKSMRAVLAEASARGITITPAGTGIARVQQPAAGSILHEGERIRVQFSR